MLSAAVEKPARVVVVVVEKVVAEVERVAAVVVERVAVVVERVAAVAVDAEPVAAVLDADSDMCISCYA